jgi:hypothetical protein
MNEEWTTLAVLETQQAVYEAQMEQKLAKLGKLLSEPELSLAKRVSLLEQQLAEHEKQIVMLRERLVAKDALLRQARDTLEITHELYANASSGYGFARPDNPHNFHCDIDCCSKEEIEAHSKACDDYAAGRKASDDSWGIGTYCCEYTPALHTIAAIDKELGK